MPFLFANNASTTLNGAILAADTSITATNGAVFPSPVSGFTLRATLVRASDSAVELVDITAISTNDLTVVRAREGTTALDFADSDVIEMRITDAMLSAFPQLDKNNTYTKGQRASKTTLTDGATITPDANASNNFKVTLGGNRTMANMINAADNQSGRFEIAEDATGNRALAWGSNYVNPPASLSTIALAVDYIPYDCVDVGGTVYIVLGGILKNINGAV